MFAGRAVRIAAGAIRAARDEVLSRLEAGRLAAVDRQLVAFREQPVAPRGRPDRIVPNDSASRSASPGRRWNPCRDPAPGLSTGRGGGGGAGRRGGGGGAGALTRASPRTSTVSDLCASFRRCVGTECVGVRRDGEFDDRIREALELKREPDGRRRQSAERIAADLIGDAGREDASVLGGRDHRHARQHAARFVRDHAVHAARGRAWRVRPPRRCRKDEQNRAEGQG